MEYCAAEREGTPTLQDSMDGTGEHYAKWNKLGGERQIPYDLTYKWNLINKTNKRAKYHQRHGNKGQTDSDQKGEGREITGRGGEGASQGTCMYKGPMDKDNVGDWMWEDIGRAGESDGGKWGQKK